ncbi:MAG: 5-(carboxyamino)imidazole ribonucleotide mutase [Acidaminococcus sp.]|nr:5-(carboxyamino)imidazole ribonucleotide mutase [Acidaminococcus sp.]MDD7398065.1 5-(carboxyamino)imidazole ribonucleotide mutase [Bacillota bacterium]MDY4559073.1 5-(carboxyamino)imidazole ribonucleotide mutase [Eubacteriales bacterium]MDY5345237.1 5-(carboxyamino)imidazole ribonucleotide mutase [Eubacteriales bacterium]
MKKVGILMGSKSDYDVVKQAVDILKEFGVETEVRIISAHRTPDEADEYATTAIDRNVGVIIAAAGKAAHLGGVLAARTTLPIIGLPIQTSMMGGLDSLLSIVQMPKGVPVACVGVGAGQNAGLLAVQMLAIEDTALASKLSDYKSAMAKQIIEDDKALQD